MEPNHPLPTSDSPMREGFLQQGPIPWPALLKGSFYYPCCGTDPWPLEMFRTPNQLFVYTDYLYDHGGSEAVQQRIMAWIRALPGFLGMRILQPRDLGWDDWNCATRTWERASARPWGHYTPHPVEPFGVLAAIGNCWLLYLATEAIATYEALFLRYGVRPDWVALIQPGIGTGGAWCDFRNPGNPLDQALLSHPQGLPPHLVTNRYGHAYPAWENAGGMHRVHAFGQDELTVWSLRPRQCQRQLHRPSMQWNFLAASGRWEEALALAESGPELGPPEVATALHGLAKASRSADSRDRTNSWFVRALQIREDFFGLEHLDVAATLIDYAAFLAYDCDPRAEDLYLRAERIIGNLSGRDHPRMMAVMEGLDSFYATCDEDRRCQVEAIRKRMVDINEKAFGSDAAQVASSLVSLGFFYESNEDFSQAIRVFERACTIYAQAAGADAEVTIETMIRVAEALRGQGSHDQAETVLKRTLSLRETPAAFRSLAHVYADLGRPSEQLACRTRSVEVYEAQSPRSEGLNREYRELATLCIEQKQFLDAERHLLRALELTDHSQKGEALFVASRLSQLADVYRKLGRDQEAVVAEQRALAMRESAQSPQ